MKVNKILGFILLFQFILCCVIAVLYGVFKTSSQSSVPYITWPEYVVAVDSILDFFTYFVLINTMIPISLVVSI